MPRNMRARRMPHHPDLPQMSAYSSHPWPQLATTRGRVRQGRDFWNSSPSLTSAATSKPFCPIGNLRFVRISSRACIPQGCRRSRQPRPLAPGPKSREQNGGRNYSSIWPGGSASAIREGSAVPTGQLRSDRRIRDDGEPRRRSLRYARVYRRPRNDRCIPCARSVRACGATSPAPWTCRCAPILVDDTHGHAEAPPTLRPW